MKVFFVDVILPLALHRAFTYRVPQNMAPFLRKGVRVVVPFGKQKLYTGIVQSIHENAPRGYSAKYIDDILDQQPVVNERQMTFWNWMSEYYMCTRGEVMLASLPAGLRLSSESKFIPNPAFDGDLSDFSEREVLLMEALASREVLTTTDIEALLGIKSIHQVVKRLLEEGALMIMEDLKERFKPKVELFVRLSEACSDEEGLESAFRALEKAPKQLEILMVFVQQSGRYSEPEEVKKSVLQKLAGATSAQIRELEKKGVFEIYEKEVGRLPSYEKSGEQNIHLSKGQKEALETIESAFAKKEVALLHGVTSSGKTEIYIELIRKEIAKGKQVLYMLPEIALTTQMIDRLRRYFGDLVAVYHSRFNQNERVELWNLVASDNSQRGRIVLGARSSVFLPFTNLGLVIVDEEHETSFKQFDPAPRYHGRDSGIVLAGIHRAKTLLGSATPSIESMFNVKQGKYGYASLTERFGGQELPLIEPISLQGSKSYFTEKLLEKIGEALSRKEQIILFQNRRGYAPILLCNACGWSPECTRCDVTLTYHKAQDRFLCHYCGNRYNAPPACAQCGSPKLRLAGVGTERIEEELPVYFPDAVVGRLDLDSTRQKNAYSRIISDFQDGAVDILIGTQMVTKGLDFGRVSLVGILNADLLLKFPDFRAGERAFQLMTQVAGRAGRRKRRGEVFIQTHDVSQWIIQQVVQGNYAAVIKKELEERRQYAYPPFTRLIKLTLRHRQSEMVDYCAEKYKTELLKILPEAQILGPEYPSVARIKNAFNKNILLKILPNQNLKNIKDNLAQLNGSFFEQKEFRSVRLIINVDPQ